MNPRPRTLPVTLALGILLFSACAAHATPVEWIVEDGGNGHFYDFVAYPTFRDIGWNTARAHAEAQSYRGVPGHLITITSAAEQAFFASLPRATNWIYYLGGSQDFGATRSDEGWSWVTGEPWDYTAWATFGGIPAEPSDTVGGIYPGVEDGTENYLSTYPNPAGNYSMWNDIGGGFAGSGISHYVIEFDLPEPSSAALSLAGLALLRRSRRPRG